MKSLKKGKKVHEARLKRKRHEMRTQTNPETVSTKKTLEWKEEIT